MFRMTEDPSSGSLVHCLAKNYKNDSIDLAHVNGHDRNILLIFSQALYKAPWWWILCDPKHVGALLNILYFNCIYKLYIVL